MWFPSLVLLKGLQELMASSQSASVPGSPSSSSLQIRLTRLDENSGGASPAPSSVAALQIPLQIPLQITHLGEPRTPALHHPHVHFLCVCCCCGHTIFFFMEILNHHRRRRRIRTRLCWWIREEGDWGLPVGQRVTGVLPAAEDVLVLTARPLTVALFVFLC